MISIRLHYKKVTQIGLVFQKRLGYYWLADFRSEGLETVDHVLNRMLFNKFLVEKRYGILIDQFLKVVKVVIRITLVKLDPRLLMLEVLIGVLVLLKFTTDEFCFELWINSEVIRLFVFKLISIFEVGGELFRNRLASWVVKVVQMYVAVFNVIIACYPFCFWVARISNDGKWTRSYLASII